MYSHPSQMSYGDQASMMHPPFSAAPRRGSTMSPPPSSNADAAQVVRRRKHMYLFRFKTQEDLTNTWIGDQSMIPIRLMMMMLNPQRPKKENERCLGQTLLVYNAQLHLITRRRFLQGRRMTSATANSTSLPVTKALQSFSQQGSRSKMPALRLVRFAVTLKRP